MNNHQYPRQREIKKEDIPGLILVVVGTISAIALICILAGGSK